MRRGWGGGQAAARSGPLSDGRHALYSHCPPNLQPPPRRAAPCSTPAPFHPRAHIPTTISTTTARIHTNDNAYASSSGMKRAIFSIFKGVVGDG